MGSSVFGEDNVTSLLKKYMSKPVITPMSLRFSIFSAGIIIANIAEIFAFVTNFHPLNRHKAYCCILEML